MDNSKQRKLGAILTYVSIIVSTLIGLLYTPFLISKLGQSEYGLYSLVASVIGYLTILDFGFGNAIVVYTAKYREKKEFENEKKLHGMFRIVYFIIGIVAGLIGIVLFLNVNNMFGNTMNSIEISKMRIMMLILTFNLAISFIFNIYSSIINAYEKFVFQKLVSIVNSLIKPILMIPLLFMGYKSITMCLIITFVNTIVLISNYIYCNNKLKVKIKYNGFDKNIFKVIIGYSFWVFLAVIVDKINWSLDQFILGSLCGTIAVSIYSVASQLNLLFINLSSVFASILLPKMSKMIVSNASSEEVSNVFIKVGRIQYYIIFLAVSNLVLFGKEFIYLWVGRNYETSYYVALILIIPVCIPLIQNVGLSILQAMNKYKFKSISTFIMAIFNIIISYFLAKSYGPIGAAVGTAIALIVCNIIIMNIYYLKVIKLYIGRFWLNILKMTLTFMIPLCFINTLIHFTKYSGLKALVTYGIIYTILFGLVSYFITMNDYEKQLVKKALNKFHIRKVK